MCVITLRGVGVFVLVYLARTTDQLALADLAVVPDLSAINRTAKWQMYVNGGTVATTDYLTSRGLDGACLIFKPAGRGKVMKLWAPAAFVEHNPNIYKLLDRAIGSPNAKWSWFVGSHVEFVRKALKTKSLVGLVT